MKSKSFWGVALSVLACVFLVASVSEARQIKGKTKSYFRKLVVSVIATDGSATTAPVNVVRKIRTDSGILRIGRYTLQVPEGQKVMIVFQKKITKNGRLIPKTVARFATDASGLTRTTQLNVTAALPGGSEAIGLGKIMVKRKFAKPRRIPVAAA